MIQLPNSFIESTKILLGNEYLDFEQSLFNTPPVSIRVNNKITYQPSEERVDWCEDGYYLQCRPLFTADPFFHSGVYYVQEASSMFLYQAVKQLFSEARTVLDLCAAPGGKSTLLSQALSENSLLVSNEIIHSRANILSENLLKWGNENTLVSQNAPKDFASLNHFFDAIIMDAPCSGEGMFRKDEKAIHEWSEKNVNQCIERQRRIATDCWDALKPSGIFVYSTCTYNRKENEENVEWIAKNMGASILQLDIENFEGITETESGYRFFPHKTKGEGFFISVLKKNDKATHTKKQEKSLTKGTKFANRPNIIHLKNPEKWVMVPQNNKISAYNAHNINNFILLNKHLRCIHSGIPLGDWKGKDFIPSAAYALSKNIDKEKHNSIELDIQQALTYLKRESLNLPNAPSGYVLVQYKNVPLGWVKNIQTRANNLYPQEWKIRMKITDN